MKPFRLAAIHDIHLGHRRTLTEDIILHLNKHFTSDKFFASIDMVVLVGDVFDNLLTLGSDESIMIDLWMARLYRLARKHNVLVRIVEGTPLHDRKQSKRFEALKEIHQKSQPDEVDLKYVSDLSVEHIPRFGIDVLYVPDEWLGGRTDKTLIQVREILEAKGLTQVDFAFMHGCFRYQIAFLPDNKVHSEQEYDKLVRYLIYIGHIHNRSVQGKIVAGGSFDRLSHGEEGMKGFVRSVFESDGTHRTKFVDNPDAKIYKTIYCHQNDVEQSLLYIDEIAKALPSLSYVRVIAPKKCPILASLAILQKRWPLLHWTCEEAKDKEQQEHDAKGTALLIEDDTFIPLSVTKENIAQLLIERISDKGVSDELLLRCEKQMQITLQVTLPKTSKTELNVDTI